MASDFGLDDEYVAVMKAVIYSINPEIRVTDLSHSIAPGNIGKASFLLLKSFSYFPEGTIFLFIVDPGVGSNRKSIAAKIQNKYIVCPDNGIISRLIRYTDVRNNCKIYNITNDELFKDRISRTFHGRDIFAPAAAKLACGFPLDKAGTELGIEDIIHLSDFIKIKSDNNIKFEIIDVDRFGNLITSLNKSDIDNRNFVLETAGKFADKLSNYYMEADDDELIFYEGSSGFLELALRNSNASEILKITTGKVLELKFI